MEWSESVPMRATEAVDLWEYLGFPGGTLVRRVFDSSTAVNSLLAEVADKMGLFHMDPQKRMIWALLLCPSARGANARQRNSSH